MLVYLVQINGVGNASFTMANPPHRQLVSVGILRFQDDSGIGMSPELGQKLAQDLQQRFAGTFKDVLPRVINGATNSATTTPLTIDQIVELGKQNGVKFVIRGGLLSLTSQKAGQEVIAQLYAEIISIDTGTIVSTLRAGGVPTQAGGGEPLAAIDLTSNQFRSSVAGRALADAIVQLAELSHQALTAPASTTTQTTVEASNVDDALATSQAEAAQAAEADAELQQLIAQAEAILSDGTNVSTESIRTVSESLEALKSALASKASLMEKGEDTTQVDEELATRKQTLQTAVAQVTAEVSASSETASSGVEQPSGEKKGLLSSVDEFAAQALSILQKIQEIRSTVLGVEESVAGESDSANYEGSPIEEPASEANGVVLDENGNPVEGANVSDQESGAETATDSNGVYDLKGLVSGKIAKLLVMKGQMKMSAQADIWPGHPAILDFQFKSKFAKGKLSGFAVLPSTVLINSSKSQVSTRGILRGVVQDSLGRPVPRALVALKGLGVARTNSQGQYTFLNVPSGAHQLIINQNGLKPKSAPVQVVPQKSNDAKVQFSSADSLAKPSTKGSLTLRQAGSQLEGTVVDNDNYPIAGAKVSVTQQVSSVYVLTGTKGSFELKNLKPGSYRLVVSRVGFESMNQNIVLSANGTERRNLQLRKQSSPLVANVMKSEMERRRTVHSNDQKVSRVQVNTSASRMVNSHNGRISGRVTDADTGKPVPSAVITIEGQPPLKSDHQGNYELNNLATGSYKVRVNVVGYSTEAKTIKVREGSFTREDFALKAERRAKLETVEVTDRSGIRISDREQRSKTNVAGQVIDARTRRPIAGAMISIPGQQGAITDSAGRFLIRNLMPGNYQVGVSKTGYSSDQRSIGVRSGETINVSFTLTTRAIPSIRLPRP